MAKRGTDQFRTVIDPIDGIDLKQDIGRSPISDICAAQQGLNPISLAANPAVIA
jgi:hypothetical protein